MRTLERGTDLDAVLGGSAASGDRTAAASGERRAVVLPPRRADRPQTRPQTRPVRPSAGRPTGRRAPAAAVDPRPEVGCAGPVGGGAADPGYRMGRGARLTVTLSVVATALVLLFGWAGPGSDATPPGAVSQTVQQDESLWQLAADGLPAGSSTVADRLAAIRELNGWQAVAADTVVPAGTTVLLPVG